jgi:general secretion pathway protein K
MRAAPQKFRSDTQRGFILVAVLWMLLALATLTTIYSLYLGNSAMALSVYDDRLKSEAAVSGALELVNYQLSDPNKAARPTGGSFSFRLGHANVAVDYVTEAARIDLNAASRTLLTGLFAVVGASPAKANWYAERVIGWRTRPEPGKPNDEDALYRAAGVRYAPRGAPFTHVNELYLVYGIPRAIIERASEYITVYSGRRNVDIRTAAPEVIAALPGMTPGRLNAFLNARETITDPKFLLNAIGGPQPGVGIGSSNGIRVHIRIRFENGAQSATEVVIFLGDPYRVLTWREDATLQQTRTTGR